MVEIFPGAERPYYIKSQGVFDGTYVRVAGTTRHVEDYMLRELMLEGKNRYFDSEICQNMDISDSEIEELCKSLKEEGGKVYPTNAYALLTGRMVGQPVIQCGVFKVSADYNRINDIIDLLKQIADQERYGKL